MSRSVTNRRSWRVLGRLATGNDDGGVFDFLRRLAGVATGGIPGPLFYLSGLLPWFFFSTAVTAAANSVVGSERLITKIYFPRLAVPFAAVALRPLTSSWPAVC